LNDRDCEFLCRAYFPSNTQFYIRRRHVEGGQSILHLRRCAIVVDVLPVQNVQIVGAGVMSRYFQVGHRSLRSTMLLVIANDEVNPYELH